jgi:ABC-type bacteriocin/lantibiotic exporter with double-glycine peptidase domain
MVLQDEKSGCGKAAGVNALKALGRGTTQEAFGELAGTGPEGTYPAGMIKAFEALGCTPVRIAESIGGRAWATLRGHLLDGHPVVLCVDNWEHWVVAIGLLGDRVVVVDSADGKVCRTYDYEELEPSWEGRGTRWRRDRNNRPFYAIAVVPNAVD